MVRLLAKVRFTTLRAPDVNGEWPKKPYGADARPVRVEEKSCSRAHYASDGVLQFSIYRPMSLTVAPNVPSN